MVDQQEWGEINPFNNEDVMIDIRRFVPVFPTFNQRPESKYAAARTSHRGHPPPRSVHSDSICTSLPGFRNPLFPQGVLNPTELRKIPASSGTSS